MATVLIEDQACLLAYARNTRLGDKYVIPKELATPANIHEFVCLQEKETVFTVNFVRAL